MNGLAEDIADVVIVSNNLTLFAQAFNTLIQALSETLALVESEVVGLLSEIDSDLVGLLNTVNVLVPGLVIALFPL